MSRPEHKGPPEFVYNFEEAKKYTANSRISQIQRDMAERALELLELPDDKQCLLLDIGCGSGLSGEVLDDEGHHWIGFDISEAMLGVAKEREVDGDLFLQDAGEGLGFRPGMFDGAISVSVLQWLCNADKKHHVPQKRLARFFSSLYSSLSRGARAVFQFYPENDLQIQMIMTAATKVGFTGGLVVDFPKSKSARKYYLCLFTGGSGESQSLPEPLADSGDEHVKNTSEEIRDRRSKGNNRKPIKDKNWALRKKELARKRGLKVASDSKYTARRRGPRF